MKTYMCDNCGHINQIDNYDENTVCSNCKASSEKLRLIEDRMAENEIDAITVNIDVSNLKSNKKYTKTIKKPKGIREISSKTVTAEISIDDEASTEVSGVRLSYINLGSNYTVQATESSTTEIPVTLKGVKSVIENITATDIEAYVDLKDLGVGEHEVDVKVKGNDPKVNYSPRITKVKIQIADKQ
jgi:YbbR domain-containing protein